MACNHQHGVLLTFPRFVLPPLVGGLEDDVDGRGAPPLLVVPTAGDIARAGTLGGGPGSAPGERRCMERECTGACIVTPNLDVQCFQCTERFTDNRAYGPVADVLEKR